MSAQTELKCKHCGLRIAGTLHLEGRQAGRMRCAIEPYGYNAEPHGQPCSAICNGFEPGLIAVDHE